MCDSISGRTTSPSGKKQGRPTDWKDNIPDSIPTFHDDTDTADTKNTMKVRCSKRFSNTIIINLNSKDYGLFEI